MDGGQGAKEPDLECCSHLDGAFYDLDLAASDVVAGRLRVKYISGLDDDVELVDLDDIDQRLRLTSLAVQDEECGRLQPGALVSALFDNGSESKWFNAEVLEVARKGHANGPCDCRFIVAFHSCPMGRQARGEVSGAVAPPPARHELPVACLCWRGGSAADHPAVQRWRRRLQEAHAQAPAGLATLGEGGGARRASSPASKSTRSHKHPLGSDGVALASPPPPSKRARTDDAPDANAAQGAGGTGGQAAGVVVQGLPAGMRARPPTAPQQQPAAGAAAGVRGPATSAGSAQGGGSGQQESSQGGSGGDMDDAAEILAAMAGLRQQQQPPAGAGHRGGTPGLHEGAGGGGGGAGASQDAYQHAVTKQLVVPRRLPLGPDGYPLSCTAEQRAGLRNQTQTSRPTVYVDAVDIGFPPGWMVLERVRASGQTQGMKDHYFFTPQGQIMRHKNEALAAAGLRPGGKLVPHPAAGARLAAPGAGNGQQLAGQAGGDTPAPAAAAAAAAAPPAAAATAGPEAGAQGLKAMANQVLTYRSLELTVHQVGLLAGLHAGGQLPLSERQREVLFGGLANQLPFGKVEPLELAALAVVLEVPSQQTWAQALLQSRLEEGAGQQAAAAAAPAAEQPAAGRERGGAVAAAAAAPAQPGPAAKAGPAAAVQAAVAKAAARAVPQTLEAARLAVEARLPAWEACPPAAAAQYAQAVTEARAGLMAAVVRVQPQPGRAPPGGTQQGPLLRLEAARRLLASQVDEALLLLSVELASLGGRGVALAPEALAAMQTAQQVLGLDGSSRRARAAANGAPPGASGAAVSAAAAGQAPVPAGGHRPGAAAQAAEGGAPANGGMQQVHEQALADALRAARQQQAAKGVQPAAHAAEALRGRAAPTPASRPAADGAAQPCPDIRLDPQQIGWQTLRLVRSQLTDLVRSSGYYIPGAL